MLRVLALTVLIALILVFASSAMAQESTVEIFTPTKSKFSLDAGLHLPVNAFSLRAKPLASGYTWTSTFVPNVSPVLDLGVTYEALHFSISRQMLSRASFLALRARIPYRLFRLEVHYEDFGRFSQQTQLKESSDADASIDYVASDPSTPRPDAGFKSAGAQLRLALPLGDFASGTSTAEALQKEQIDFALVAATDLRYQNFRATKGFLPVSSNVDFGRGGQATELRHYGAGVGGGLEVAISRALHRFVIEGVGGGRLMNGRTTNLDGSSASQLQFASFMTARLGWEHNGPRHQIGADILLDGTAARAGELALSGMHIDIGMKYGYTF